MAFLCLSATPVMADLVLTYEIDRATLTFTQTTNNLQVTETATSDLFVTKMNDVTFATLDDALVDGGANFNLLLDLILVDEPGANNWSATGSMKFTDTTTATYAVEAAVTSTSIAINGGELEIKGYLYDLAPNTSILVNRGDPWVFAGNGDVGPADEDGTANQVTMGNRETYDGGQLVTIKFGVSGTLDDLFSANQTLSNGEVKGQVVPAPAAVLLGLLGLSVAGIKLRKFA